METLQPKEVTAMIGIDVDKLSQLAVDVANNLCCMMCSNQVYTGEESQCQQLHETLCSILQNLQSWKSEGLMIHSSQDLYNLWKIFRHIPGFGRDTTIPLDQVVTILQQKLVLQVKVLSNVINGDLTNPSGEEMRDLGRFCIELSKACHTEAQRT